MKKIILCVILLAFSLFNCANQSDIKQYNESLDGLASRNNVSTFLSISAEDSGTLENKSVTVRVEVAGGDFQKEFPFNLELSNDGKPQVLELSELPVDRELTFRVLISNSEGLLYFGESTATLKKGNDNIVEVKLIQNSFNLTAKFTIGEFPQVCDISGKILFTTAEGQPPMEIPLSYKAELAKAESTLTLSNIDISFNGDSYKIEKVSGKVTINEDGTFSGDIDAVLPLGSLKIATILKVTGDQKESAMTNKIEFVIKDEAFKDLNGKLKAETAGNCK